MWRLLQHSPALLRASSLPIVRSLLSSAPLARMDLHALVATLERIAPTVAAESWDNVGLLVEPRQSSTIKKVLITNDLTEPVLEEALGSSGDRVGLVVSYHPPLFKPFKKLTQQCAKERIVLRAVEEGVAVYSPHTSLDNMVGGINDWLLSAVGEGQVTAFGVQKHSPPYLNLLEIRGNHGDCGTWLQQQRGVGETHISTDGVLVAECTDGVLAALLPALRGDYSALSVSVRDNSKRVPTLCGGKLLTLHQPVTLSKAVQRVKEHLKLKHVRLACPFGPGKDPVIKTVGACAGSGGSVLAGGKADLLLTGEMSHHQVLEAVSRGSAVILCEHSNTERGFLQGRYKELLEKAVDGKVLVSVAAADTDPLNIV